MIAQGGTDVSGHEHRPVGGGWDGPHHHRICADCGHLLCATSRSSREEVQTRRVTGRVTGVRSRFLGVQLVIGDSQQTRTLRITTARCGHKVITVVEATPWQ